MNDKLILSQCHFQCYIGLTAEERIEPQTIILDIEIFFDSTKAAASDTLADTIDYRNIHADIKNLIEKKEFNLIEKMAGDTANFILKNFPVSKVWLRLQKPAPMQKRGGAWVGIEITRS